MNKVRKLLLLVAPLVFAPSAFAQAYGSGPYVPGNTTYTIIQGEMATSNLRMSQMISDMNRGSSRSRGKRTPNTTPGAGTRGGGTTGTARTAPASASTGTTTFRPVAAMLLPSKLAAATPDERAAAEQFFAKLLNGYKDLVRQRGAPANDVARAASFMIISSHDIYDDGRPLTEAQRNALREQMREVFAGDAGFQQRSNREKQEIFESYALMGMFLGTISQGAQQQGDAAKLAELRELARKQLEETFGVPVSRLSFAESGVEIR